MRGGAARRGRGWRRGRRRRRPVRRRQELVELGFSQQALQRLFVGGMFRGDPLAPGT